MFAALNPGKEGKAARDFNLAVSPPKAPDVAGRRKGGKRAQTFNFKRFSKAQRMQAMRRS